ncbi:MAG TPA: alpha/beta hydrolase [Chthoniobacterales bacterium]|nr:alpha/beta hydrolase [Chthoniobacterales bacterium]
MNDIAGIPYVAAIFDKDGALLNKQEVKLPDGTTDAVVASHGWNNNQEQAEEFYTELFTNFVAVASDQVQNKKIAIVGVIWPSKRFTDVVDAAVAEQARGGGVGFGTSSSAADETIKAKLDVIGTMFDKKAAKKITAAKNQIGKLESDLAARRKFVDELRGLLDESAAHEEDNSALFFQLDGSVILEKLKSPTPLVSSGSGGGGGAASIGTRPKTSSSGGAAGLGDIFSGIKAGAIRFLNYLAYYEMKQRAGTVGQNGVGPMLDRLANNVQRIHLVGHSFGCRVVTAAAAASTTDKLQSMTLLQAAFSHNSFSKSMNGFFRSVVDNKRIKGPIVVTYTPNDRAVGIAYPAASRLAGTVASAFGDAKDKFGGLGRNGAQKMESGEVVQDVNQLLAVGGSYGWRSGHFHNLESSKYIINPSGGDAHMFVTGKEVAWTISRAME